MRVAVALDARGGMRFEVVSRSSSSAAEAATGAAEAYEEAKIAALASKTSAALVDVFGAGWSLARRDAARLSRFARAVSTAVSRPGAALGACLDFGDGPTLALVAAGAGARGVLNLERTPLAAVTSRDACAAASGGGGRSPGAGNSSVIKTAFARDAEEMLAARAEGDRPDGWATLPSSLVAPGSARRRAVDAARGADADADAATSALWSRAVAAVAAHDRHLSLIHI